MDGTVPELDRRSDPAALIGRLRGDPGAQGLSRERSPGRARPAGPGLLDDGVPPGGRCRLLGVFAHPDDETFCAGGTFARYAEQGAEIMVVSATRGQAGQIRDAAAGTRRTIAAVREAELRLACERLGITQVRCLDHVDGALADADFAALVDEVPPGPVLEPALSAPPPSSVAALAARRPVARRRRAIRHATRRPVNH